MSIRRATHEEECLARIARNIEQGVGLAFDTDGIEIVLGAGGMKCLAEIGAVQAAEEMRVVASTITAVSGGVPLAAFLSCGYTAKRVEEIFSTEPLWQEIARQLNCLKNLVRSGFGLAGGVVKTLRKLFRKLFAKYGIKANRRLRVVAFNLNARSPIVFEGTRYDLAEAAAASCAVPIVMAPVKYTPRPGVADEDYISDISRESMQRAGVLVDGGLAGLCPRGYGERAVLAFEVELATEMPAELPTMLELAFHAVEMMVSRLTRVVNIQHRGKREHEDIVITVGGADLGALSFSASNRRVAQIINRGYWSALPVLQQAVAAGRIPVLPTVAA